MRVLPTGTVTFLFTDIEGSTRMLQELGDAYTAVLLEHRRILREVWARHDGVEFGTEGDAFFIAFAQATDAAAAALDAQASLTGGPVRVRVGIHTGEPTVVAGDYVGLDVHRAARICSAAHGGQVVISERTRAFLSGEVKDLGLHRLKDLTEPERLFQLGAGDFPPLRSLNATNLPTQPSPLVGRKREIEELTRLVRERRVVTLTGPGGMGKTRLALQVAAELVEEFKDGTFFVPLAAVEDPRLVLPSIASTLGTDRSLGEHIGEKAILLVLDNIEQVLTCASDLSVVLSACPKLRLLVTSRAPLRISGEAEYPIDPLPDDDAVALFLERALRDDFAADTVAEICRRVDRLPLAVELAAARTRIFSGEQLLERLEKRLPLLTAGRRDVPERHRTLRAAIEWSYDLLPAQERSLFVRLSVFAGSFDLEAAEAVVEASIDELESLVEVSLLRARDGRFFMLETIREYATEQLAARDDAADVRSRHAAHYLSLAESAEIEGRDVALWIDRLSLEDDNMRAALAWTLDANEALRFCIALTDYWEMRSHLDEAVRWFQRAIALGGEMEPGVKALALREYGTLLVFTNRLSEAVTQLEQSVALWRLIGDAEGLMGALRALGSALTTDESSRDAALPALHEALALSESTGDRLGERRVLHLLGEFYRDRGEFERAADIFERCVGIAREMGATKAVGATTHSWADLELDRGNLARAEELYRESLRSAVENHLDRHKVYCLAGLASVAARREDAELASTLWRAVERAERDLNFRLLEIERARYEREVSRVKMSDDVPATALDECVQFALR